MTASIISINLMNVVLQTEIDCGDPGEMPGLQSDILPTLKNTTYGASFKFECESNFTREGKNSDPDSVVRCLKDGQWDLGGLRCTGMLHIDLNVTMSSSITVLVTYYVTRVLVSWLHSYYTIYMCGIIVKIIITNAPRTNNTPQLMMV